MARGHLYLPIVDEDGNLILNVNTDIRREAVGFPSQAVEDIDGNSLGSTPSFASGILDLYTPEGLGGFFRIHVWTAGGYEDVIRHVPIASGAGVDADVLLGAAFNMVFEAGTSAPPSAGAIRANHATWGSVTEIYVSQTNFAGSDLSGQLALIAQSDRLRFTMPDGTQAYAVVQTAVDSGAYYTFGVSGLGGSPPVEGSIGFNFSEKGDVGIEGDIVALTQTEYDALDPPDPDTLYVIVP